jgi:hypothetical protein
MKKTRWQWHTSVHVLSPLQHNVLIHITTRDDSWLLTASPSGANRGAERITPPFMLTGQRLHTQVKDYRPTFHNLPPDPCTHPGFISLMIYASSWGSCRVQTDTGIFPGIFEKQGVECIRNALSSVTIPTSKASTLRLWALAVAKNLQTSARCMGGSKPGKISTVVLQHRPNYTNYHKLSHNYHLSGETHWCKKSLLVYIYEAENVGEIIALLPLSGGTHRTRNSLKQRMFTKLLHYCHRAEKHIDAEIVCLFILWSRECSECSYSNDLCTVHFL